MNFRSIDEKIMFPKEYKVTRTLKAKGLTNEEWGGITLKPMKAEIMIKSMEVAESSYYLAAVWIRLKDSALLEVEAKGVSFSIPDYALQLYLEAYS